MDGKKRMDTVYEPIRKCNVTMHGVLMIRQSIGLN